MPCYDGREEIWRKKRDEELSKLRAVLCSVMRASNCGWVVRNLDPECGVSKEWVENWWWEHSARDAARKMRAKT